MSIELVEQLYSEEEEMAESILQHNLTNEVESVLKEMLGLQDHFVSGNLEILPPKDGWEYSFHSVAPDVVFFRGVRLTKREQNSVKSWNMSQPNRSAPTVAIEICSDSTWTIDVTLKPIYYGELGLKEYYTYDPREGVSDIERLRGWRYLPDGTPIPMLPDEQGRLWSDELESWLVGDGPDLRLYDREGQRRLTQLQASDQREATERAAKEAERAAKEAERAAKEAERQARIVAERTAKAERAAKKAERQARLVAERETKLAQKARLAAERTLKAEQKAMADMRQKMRERGIDPDNF